MQKQLTAFSRQQFSQKVPSQLFDKVLNTILTSGKKFVEIFVTRLFQIILSEQKIRCKMLFSISFSSASEMLTAFDRSAQRLCEAIRQGVKKIGVNLFRNIMVRNNGVFED